MVVAIIALVGAFGGSAIAEEAVDFAKSRLINGKRLKSRSIPGKKVKKNTLGGTEINESKLGKVPSATNADHALRADRATNADHATRADSATNATNAINATNAANATTAINSGQLGGIAASDFLKDVHQETSVSSHSADSPKTAVVYCSSGEKAIGGGAYIGGTPAVAQNVMVREGRPFQEFTIPGNPAGYTAEAQEISPNDGDWNVTVTVICASGG